MATELVQRSCSEVTHEACDEQVKRVLSSRAFAKSFRLVALFEYICAHSLSGRLDELTEQQIGIHVFQRVPGYNSAEDTIVRGTARHLRRRLEEYYEHEGANDPVYIGIPKGGYVASFTPAAARATDQNEFEGKAERAANSEHSVIPAFPGAINGWPRSAKASCAVAVALALLLPALTFLAMRGRRMEARNPGPVALWRALFQAGRKTLIVPPDAALDAFVSLEQKAVTLEQYTEQSYQREATAASTPGNSDATVGMRSMTPMSALRLVANLVRVPAWIGEPALEDWTEIRYARDLNAADVSNSNLILIGSETFNPWITLYQPELDFATHWDFTNNTYTVTDRAPRGDEPSRYSFNPQHGPTGAMTLVALTENTQGRGRVLLLEGTSMGTTYGGMRFLFDERLWGPVLAEATDRKGQLHDFEALLRNDFLRGGVSNTRVIAIHVH